MEAMEVQLKRELQPECNFETEVEVKIEAQPEIKIETDVIEIEVHTEIQHSKRNATKESKPQSKVPSKTDVRLSKSLSVGIAVRPRKRKLIIDELTMISVSDMKSQLCDWSDITTSLELTSRTRWQTHWKELGGFKKMFAYPGHPMLSSRLLKLFQRHLTTRSAKEEDFNESYKDLYCSHHKHLKSS